MISMVFHKQALLNKDDEFKLKTRMLPLWLDGTSGKDIAKELQFGVKGTIFAKIKPNYIYFFRQKFNDDEAEDNTEFFGKFPIRRKAPFAKGETRYNQQPKEIGVMTIETFMSTLNSECPNTIKNQKLRSFFGILWNTPLRCSEIIERTIDNFEINEKEIIIHLLRKKKRENRKIKDEPITIRRNFPLMRETAEFLLNYKKKHLKKKDRSILRPFDFSPWSAWWNTKKVLGVFPHFFRFNFISRQASKPNTGITKIKSKTHLTAEIIDRYLMTNAKTEKEVDDSDEAEYKEKGLIY